MATTRGLDMASSPGGVDMSSANVAQPVFRTVKLFDLGLAPAFIQDAIRPIAVIHLSKVDGCAIWEVTVGSYDWQDAAEEWALHRWLRENGAAEGENVLLQLDDLT
jgi:hypothetical protein